MFVFSWLNWDEHQTGADRWNEAHFHAHSSPTMTEKFAFNAKYTYEKPYVCYYEIKHTNQPA